MERLERRAIGRVAFPSKAVIVICDSEEIIHVHVRDIGPIGVGILLDADAPSILGKDVILVAETLIMYSDVVREAKQKDGTVVAGLAARRFPKNVMKFLVDSIEQNANEGEGIER